MMLMLYRQRKHHYLLLVNRLSLVRWTKCFIKTSNWFCCIMPPQYPFLMHHINDELVMKIWYPKQERMQGIVSIKRMPHLVWFPIQTHP